MTRSLWLGLFAAAILAAEAAPARADVPAPDGKYYPKPWGYGAPPPGWFERNNPPQPPQPQPLPEPDGVLPKPPMPPVPNAATPNPLPNKEMWPDDPVVRPAPKRTGPFRSCGSGMGLGLAGIGAAWAMMWLGNRFARSLSRSPSARG